MDQRFAQPRSEWRRYGMALAVAVAGLALTGVGTVWMKAVARENDERAFRSIMHQTLTALESRVDYLAMGLRGLRDVAGQDWPPMGQSWERHIDEMDPWTHYKGIYDFGLLSWAPERRRERTTFDQFDPIFYTVASKRGTRPGLERAPADLLNAEHNSALGWARHYRGPAATERITLGNGRAGFRIYLPVTENTAPPAGMRGVVFGSIDMEALLHSDYVRNLALGFAVYDGIGVDEKKRFWGESLEMIEKGEGGRPYLSEATTVPVFGEKHTLWFYTRPEFEARSMKRWPWAMACGGSALTVLVSAMLFVERRARLREERISSDLRATSERLKGLLQERERVSRDLHDIVIQSIYGVGLGLQSCRRLMGRDPDKASERMTENLAALNGVVEQLRRFITNLRPESIPGVGLKHALEGLALTLERADAAKISLETEEGAAGRLSSEQAVHVLSIAREAVSNCLRHSGGDAVAVRLFAEGDQVWLEVSDNGSGFDVATVRRGSGLNNIESRVAELGGDLKVGRGLEKGTVLQVGLPALKEEKGA